jgi:hypothetical protein
MIYLYYKNLGRQISKRSDQIKKQQIKINKLKLLESQLHDCLKRKATIKPILEKFQTDFEARHNRKIKYKSDITRVAEEYALYTKLKKEISAIEMEIEGVKRDPD